MTCLPNLLRYMGNSLLKFSLFDGKSLQSHISVYDNKAFITTNYIEIMYNNFPVD